MCFLPLKGLLTEHWRHQIVLFTFQHLTWTQTRQAGMLEIVNEGNAHSLVTYSNKGESNRMLFKLDLIHLRGWENKTCCTFS